MRGVFSKTLFFTFSASSIFSQADSNTVGGYIGGTVGSSSLEFSGKSNSGLSLSVLGGYNATDYFGIEGSFYLAPSINSGEDNASVASLNVTPKIMIPIGDQFSFYGKAGLTSTSTAFDNVDINTFWGIGSTYGLGARFFTTENMVFHIGYDVITADLEDVDDFLPDIEIKVSQFSLGLYYQF